MLSYKQRLIRDIRTAVKNADLPDIWWNIESMNSVDLARLHEWIQQAISRITK